MGEQNGSGGLKTQPEDFRRGDKRWQISPATRGASGGCSEVAGRALAPHAWAVRLPRVVRAPRSPGAQSSPPQAGQEARVAAVSGAVERGGSHRAQLAKYRAAVAAAGLRARLTGRGDRRGAGGLWDGCGQRRQPAMPQSCHHLPDSPLRPPNLPRGAVNSCRVTALAQLCPDRGAIDHARGHKRNRTTACF